MGLAREKGRGRRSRLSGSGSEPLVSVSLPYFDSRDRLAGALASLIAQTWESWECLFVDDGSTDRPREILEQAAEPRIRYFRLAENAGRGAARQLALDRARGDYHCMLDADDWIYPERVATQLGLFRDAPGLDLVGAGVAVVDSADHMTGIRRRGCRGPEPRLGGPITSLLRLPVGHASSMVRMAAARRAGYDPACSRFEDREFLLKVLVAGRFGIVPGALYAYREAERLDLAAVRASLASARAVYRRHRRRLGAGYLPARAMLAARSLAYGAGGAIGLGRWLVRRRSDTPTADERAAFDEARRGVEAVRRERFGDAAGAAAGAAASVL